MRALVRKELLQLVRDRRTLALMLPAPDPVVIFGSGIRFDVSGIGVELVSHDSAIVRGALARDFQRGRMGINDHELVDAGRLDEGGGRLAPMASPRMLRRSWRAYPKYGITAVTRAAPARRQASASIASSMRCSSTEGPVDCTMNTCSPR